MTRQRMQRMRERLSAALNTDDIQIQDDGHLHRGHPGARSGLGHFSAVIRAECFAGQSVLERHRMVYDALGDMMQTDIHALSVRARTPDE
ncbi:MAG: BolA family transcriptional regulator [Salinisphaeraceae bacterium]|nr:BolA family transcriptional regulator [Salinisphaeraceae bacterium]